MSNAAFIDAQNLYRGIKSLGWKLDWHRLRIYLKDKYRIDVAYLFIGYIPSHQALYADLQKDGYVLMFKPVIYDAKGSPKGNCDADLVLRAMIEKDNYDQAVIVTSDGDFYSLVKYLYDEQKLLMVLSPYIKTCSKLLKKEAKEKINYMDNLQGKVGM